MMGQETCSVTRHGRVRIRTWETVGGRWTYYGTIRDVSVCVHGVAVDGGKRCDPCWRQHLAESRQTYEEIGRCLRWAAVNGLSRPHTMARRCGVKIWRAKHVITQASEWGGLPGGKPGKWFSAHWRRAFAGKMPAWLERAERELNSAAGS